MKKLLAVCLAAAILTLAGCSADTAAGITEQSQLRQSDGTAVVSQTEPVSTAATVAESVDSTAEVQPAAEYETAEPGAEIDPVKLVEALGSEFLGLPESGRVYIFRNRNEQRDINGEQFYGVSCYDEGETLQFICDIWVNVDGSRAYRQYGEQYRLLPESQVYSGFDPETQLPADIFAQANSLYFAVYGDLTYDPDSIALPSERGNYYRVTGQLDTRGKLNAALERFFTGKLLDSLSEGSDNVIADDEGALYVLEHSGGNMSYLGTEYTLTELAEDKAEFTGVSKFAYEGGNITEKTFKCIAEKTASGWRFTRFTPPY